MTSGDDDDEADVRGVKKHANDVDVNNDDEAEVRGATQHANDVDVNDQDEAEVCDVKQHANDVDVNAEPRASSSQAEGTLSSDLTSAALRRRVVDYEKRVALEGELPDDEIEQVDEAFRDQLSEDDRVWAVRFKH